MSDAIDDRVDVTAGLLHAAAAESGMFITGDMRIAEADAASLLGCWRPER